MNKHQHSPKPMNLELENKLLHLEALATSIHGKGFTSFKGLPDSLQDGLLWLIKDLAFDARCLYFSLELENKLLQIEALASSIYGGGFLPFKSLAEPLQESILCLISELASTARGLYLSPKKQLSSMGKGNNHG